MMNATIANFQRNVIADVPGELFDPSDLLQRARACNTVEFLSVVSYRSIRDLLDPATLSQPKLATFSRR